MKKIILTGLMLAGLAATATDASAYGGGGGFPPGYFDRPHKGITCTWSPQTFFGRTINVPECTVDRGKKNDDAKEAKINERISRFLARILNGKGNNN